MSGRLSGCKKRTRHRGPALEEDSRRAVRVGSRFTLLRRVERQATRTPDSNPSQQFYPQISQMDPYKNLCKLWLSQSSAIEEDDGTVYVSISPRSQPRDEFAT